MIVFIEIPFAAGRGAFQAFSKALGAERVGWLNRNATLADLTSDDAPRRYDLVGGRFTMADAMRMKGVDAISTVAGDPILRLVSTWSAWERQARHPLHWVPHTFNMREALEERILPMMETTEAMMRTLRQDGVGTEIERIVEDLAQLPLILGFGDRAESFAEAMSLRLGLGPDGLSAPAFAEFARAPNNIGLYHALVDGTVPDRTLLARLLDRAGEAPVWTPNA